MTQSVLRLITANSENSEIRLQLEMFKTVLFDHKALLGTTSAFNFKEKLDEFLDFSLERFHKNILILKRVGTVVAVATITYRDEFTENFWQNRFGQTENPEAPQRQPAIE